jgi:hypothetical protein
MLDAHIRWLTALVPHVVLGVSDRCAPANRHPAYFGFQLTYSYRQPSKDRTWMQ